MKQIFLLSKQNIELSKQEVLSLTKKEHELVDNLLIINTDFKDYERLAYTKRIYELLFISYKNDLEEKLEKFSWKKIYKKDFCLRIFNSKLKEEELAGYIWDNIEKPKVNLKNPKTELHLIKKGSKFFCCLVKKQLKSSNKGEKSLEKSSTFQKQEFEARKPHLRPELMPLSLHPRLARAMVNITGIKKNEILLDPFCGIGGILIEAGLLGIKTIGYDIDERILEKAKINLEFYKIKNYELKQKDATTLKQKFDYIIADLPYGLNTRKTDLKELYTKFLKVLEKILQKKAVITFPNFIDYKKLINKTKLKIEAEFDYYIHKSLTKKIILLKP